MQNFQLLASPWWVNLFILLPFLAFYNWQGKLNIQSKILFYTAVFGVAFGYVEAGVVVYLRGLVDLLSHPAGPLQFDLQTQIVNVFPKNLALLEIFREAATIIMLVSIALVLAKKARERWAIFFWVFAFWDIFYYFWLKILIGWPESFTSPDILFLIPVPWYSQVWYPILISLLLILAVIAGRKNTFELRTK